MGGGYPPTHGRILKYRKKLKNIFEGRVGPDKTTKAPFICLRHLRMCTAIATRKIRTLMDRVNSHLFDLTLDKLVATALRAKFDEYELVGDNGQFDRPMILKLLARKYFFGICTVVLKSLPSDVVRYIGKFFDFDMSFQPRAHKYISGQIDDCNFMIEKYLKRFRRGEHFRHDDYIPVTLPGELLQRTVFAHMNGNEALSREYYKLVLQREREIPKFDKCTIDEGIQIRIRDGIAAQSYTEFVVMRELQLATLKAHYRQMRTDFVEAIKLSDDFAPALERLEAIPEYVECREIASADWLIVASIEPYHPHW